MSSSGQHLEIGMSTRASVDPDVTFTKFVTGEFVLVHMRTNKYLSLNETGSLIWDMMRNGKTLEEIAARLESSFDVTREEAQHSVIALVRELASAQLIAIDPRD